MRGVAFVVEFSKGGLDIVGGIEFGISLRFVGSCAGEGEGDGDGDGSVRSGSGVRALSRFDARGCRFVYDPSFFDYGDLEGVVGLCCMLVRANWRPMVDILRNAKNVKKMWSMCKH